MAAKTVPPASRCPAQIPPLAALLSSPSPHGERRDPGIGRGAVPTSFRCSMQRFIGGYLRLAGAIGPGASPCKSERLQAHREAPAFAFAGRTSGPWRRSKNNSRCRSPP